MPKAVDIEDFAAKLDLVCKRLNWSRAKLAQQTGVDKSLASRWMSGSARPTGNSLMLLTAAIAKALPEFTAADWQLDQAGFADRCGVPATFTAPASPAETLSATGRAIAGLATISGFNAQFEREAETYAGFYWAYRRSLDDASPVVMRRASQIRRDNGVLRWQQIGHEFEITGIVYVWDRHLYLVAEQPRYDQPVFMVFNGAFSSQPRFLSGMAVCRRFDRSANAVVSFRGVLEFVRRPFADPAEHQRYWQSMVDHPLTVPFDGMAAAGIAPEVVRALGPESFWTTPPA